MKPISLISAQPGRVLVVDDTPENIQILHQTLRDDYETFFATNGTQALSQATTLEPDIILLDVVMPGIDGYEVCRQLKQNSITRDIPVIFITALHEERDETAAFEHGAVDYIPKPIRPAVVRARVRTHLELKRQREFLARLSSIDGLTGVFNRRHFEEVYRQEWRRAQRGHAALAVLLADVDHFKLYNDTYGHQDGDDCLQQVAACMAAALQRPADCLARYGGEEFVCVLPETTAQGAILLAERMRTLVMEKALPHRASLTTDHVTISIGVAFCQPGICLGVAEELLRMADQSLYRAKREGRNRVVMAQVPS